ncbi:Neprilysin-4-like 1 [Homarus americanus]|uniref:Neprilysin-4-like 1 n=1 Tax=Homarus americanus TaxID=6706 RepID=A0A8J5JHG2_HOMAM|nr:Neprilysin-4-like 1 [Homarus americanus]
MEVEQTYKQYIKDTVKLFEASGPDALEFAAHLYHYEGRIAEITPPETILRDPQASNNLISIGELSQIARSVSTGFFFSLSLLNNYLVFSFVAAYIPYLSSENTRVLDLYRKDFTGLKEPMERWEFCIQSTAKFFKFGLGSMYERSPNRYRSRQKNSQVLNNMSLAVGYPERLLNPSVINFYYEDYTIFIKDFFQNLQDSIRSAGRQMEMRLIDPMPESDWMDVLSTDSITYIHEANKIVIPPHLLNPPLFHRNYPMAMLYGSMGVQIAHEMLRAVDSVGLSWNSRGQLAERTVYTNRSLDNLRGMADCIASATMDLAIEKDAVVDRTAPDTASEVDAVRQTYQSICSDVTLQQEDIERTCNPSLMNKPRLEAVLSQLPEFSQVFSCSQESRHFPHRLCAQLH